MKRSFEAIQKEFYDWLVAEGKTTQYAKSYLSQAVAILNPWFEQTCSVKPFTSFNQNEANHQKRSYIVFLSEAYLRELIKNNNSKAKTTRDYRSGLRAFFRFMDAENYFFDCSATTSALHKELRKIGGSVRFSKKDLMDTFYARLITQDRAYNKMIYPARLLNQIFNNSNRKADYKKIMKEVLENTKFITGDQGGYLPLSQVDWVELFANGRVKVSGKSGTYNLYTKDGNGQYVLIHANDLADLSLDHEVPLQNILDNQQAQQNYPTLKTLSDLYASFVLGTPCTGDYLSNNPSEIRDFKKNSGKCYQANQSNFNTIFIDQLFSDFDKLMHTIQLVVMQKNYNSAKGKNQIKQED